MRNISLYQHQKNGIERGVKTPICLFWEMGLGKCVASLKIFESRYETRMLVLCPLPLIKSAWMHDIETWTSLSVCNLREEVKEADVYIANYEMLYRKFSVIKNIADKNTMLVLDESQRIRNPRSKVYKKVAKLIPLVSSVYCLSGTPAPNIELELWTQVSSVRPQVLGSNYYGFRRKFFHLQRGKSVMVEVPADSQVQASLFARGWKWAISKRNRDKLMRMIAPVVDWVKKEDAVDLPPKIDVIRDVYLPQHAKRVYKELVKKLVAEVNGKQIAVQVALAKLMKLREITSGFVVASDGSVVDITDTKLRVLENVLEEIGQHQVIIWAVFRRDVERIYYDLLKDKSTFIYGGLQDKVREERINKFKSGDVQYLIANPLSIAHGLTFTNCHYAVYYSLDYSYENYAQSKDRIHRIGQVNKCEYIHLLADDTVDKDIYEAVKCKQDLSELLYKIIRDV